MKPSSIFAKASSPAPGPLGALVADLRNFTPPPKHAELLAAEEHLADCRARHGAASEKLNAASAGAREREKAGSFGGAPAAEVRQLQAQVDVLEGEVAVAREAVGAAAVAWRAEYARAIQAETVTLRTALHGLVAELDSAMEALTILTHKAATNRVGAPWLLRTAEDFLPALRRWREHLALDRKLIDQGK